MCLHLHLQNQPLLMKGYHHYVYSIFIYVLDWNFRDSYIFLFRCDKFRFNEKGSMVAEKNLAYFEHYNLIK